ncbi:MAG: nuclear transport factor 2 family protein [Solirubrobacterales bacterium]
MKSDAFKKAAETKDFAAADHLFADEPTFRSPFVFRPYEGLDAMKFILGNVIEVFENFRYTAQTENGNTAVLLFEAEVTGKQLNGVDVITFDDEGKITELMVMIRPMSGLQAVADQMGKRLEALGLDPA